MIDWNKYHLVGKSGIVLQDVADPKATTYFHSPALWETPKMKVQVQIAYVEEKPEYLIKDSWWEVDIENRVVVVIMQESLRKEFIKLMKKKENGTPLTHEEENSIETTNVLLTGLTYNAADIAVRMEKYYDALKLSDEEIETQENKDKEKSDGNEKKKEYRTKSKAGNIADIPTKMPIITNKDFQNAITYNEDDTAHLQPLSNADGLSFEDGLLYFEGVPASNATIKHLYTKDNIETFNLPMLKVFYAIILNEFKKTITEDGSIDEVITIYYPDLAKKLGKKSSISRQDVESTIDNILSFET